MQGEFQMSVNYSRACGEMMSDNKSNTLAKFIRTFADLTEAKEI